MMRTLSALLRITFFVAGIILVTLGLGNTLVAHFKVREYQSALARTPPPVAAEHPIREECQAAPLADWSLEPALPQSSQAGLYHVLHNVGWLICAAERCVRLWRFAASAIGSQAGRPPRRPASRALLLPVARPSAHITEK